MTTPTLPSKDTFYAELNESLIGEIDLEETVTSDPFHKIFYPLEKDFYRSGTS
jgi:hypothetical protein